MGVTLFVDDSNHVHAFVPEQTSVSSLNHGEYLNCDHLLTLLYSAFFATFGVFPLHALYPLMKRWTWWPQLWLG